MDFLSFACEENYEFKLYLNKFNLAQSRLKFRERSSCMSFCRSHYPSDAANLKALFQCYEDECNSYDSLSHWRECKYYSHLRQSKDLNDDHDLTKYYGEIIQMRAAKLEG